MKQRLKGIGSSQCFMCFSFLVLAFGVGYLRELHGVFCIHSLRVYGLFSHSAIMNSWSIFFLSCCVDATRIWGNGLPFFTNVSGTLLCSPSILTSFWAFFSSSSIRVVTKISLILRSSFSLFSNTTTDRTFSHPSSRPISWNLVGNTRTCLAAKLWQNKTTANLVSSFCGSFSGQKISSGDEFWRILKKEY